MCGFCGKHLQGVASRLQTDLLKTRDSTGAEAKRRRRGQIYEKQKQNKPHQQ